MFEVLADSTKPHDSFRLSQAAVGQQSVNPVLERSLGVIFAGCVIFGLRSIAFLGANPWKILIPTCIYGITASRQHLPFFVLENKLFGYPLIPGQSWAEKVHVLYRVGCAVHPVQRSPGLSVRFFAALTRTQAATP